MSIETALELMDELKDTIESQRNNIFELIEESKMEREVYEDIMCELRTSLKDAYKHISVLEDHMENLLQKVYKLEIENDKTKK